MSTKALITSDDLWKIVADGSRYELWDGQLVPMPPVGFEHSAIVGRVGEFLSRYARENKLGVVGVEAGFKLGREPERVLAPDLHFVFERAFEQRRSHSKICRVPDRPSRRDPIARR